LLREKPKRKWGGLIDAQQNGVKIKKRPWLGEKGFGVAAGKNKNRTILFAINKTCSEAETGCRERLLNKEKKGEKQSRFGEKLFLAKGNALNQLPITESNSGRQGRGE